MNIATRAAKIAIARSAAHHFFNGAAKPIQSILEAFSPPPGKERRAIGLGELAAPISNVAFSIELLLKVLHGQNRTVIPRGHDLSKLWRQLPQTTKDSARTLYMPWRTRIKEQTPQHGFIEVGRRPCDRTPPSQDPPISIDLAIDELNGAYEQWRYMFEFPERTPEYLHFHFGAALTSAKALDEAIGAHNGDKAITFTIDLL